MNNKNAITADELRALVHYDPATGIFTDRAGAPLGFQDAKGYVSLKLGGAIYRANRLAWLYATGREAVGEVDHQDFDTTNNRFANLRDISQLDSLRYKRMHRDNAARMKGVRRDPRTGGYQARISYDGRQHSLGYFDTPDLAGHAYNKAAVEHFGEFAVLNPVGRSNYGPRGLLPERRRYLNEAKEKRPRGFAAMSPEKRLAVQQKAGKALQASGKAHKFTSETASAAGKRGSAALHAKNRAMKKELEEMKQAKDKEGGEP